MSKLANILVTGGCGFIGSNFIRCLLGNPDFAGRIVNVDKLTYAGNPLNLADVEQQHGGARYFFCRRDIADQEALAGLFRRYDLDTVVNFAAESHVDRSIADPSIFIHTNIVGTFTLLETARRLWEGREEVLFHQVSTDEVYGSLGPDGYSVETSAYDPTSPYAASKAAADHLVRSYHHTYGLPVTLSNCSNNYGPYQLPEKLIPLMIENMLAGKALPVYGDGGNVRDWLYVEDHTRALWTILKRGESGESYNIGGENEWRNIELVIRLCQIMAAETGKSAGHYRSLITHVRDRPGHDKRYALDCTKIKTRLGFKQTVSFAEGLKRTVLWYLGNRRWVEAVKTGEYQRWIEMNYGQRQQRSDRG